MYDGTKESFKKSLEIFTNSIELKQKDCELLLNSLRFERDSLSRDTIILESLSSRILKNPKEFRTILMHNYNQLKQLNIKNENSHEQLTFWLITLYLKIEDDLIEDEILDLLFQLLSDPNSKLDYYKLRKYLNPEENFLFKIIRHKNLSPNSIYRVIYFQELVEKKFCNIDNKEKGKNKHKKITLEALRIFKRSLIDYYIILIINKFKNEPNKLLKKDIEIEKNCIKLFMKHFENIYFYFLELLMYCFDTTLSFDFNKDNINHRKNLLFVLIIIFKLLGINFFSGLSENLIKHLTMNMNSLHVNYLDFTILAENHNYSFSYINSQNGFLYCIDIYLSDIFCLGHEEFREKDSAKFVEKFYSLLNLILIFENLVIFHKNFLRINLFYDFYYKLQKKFLAYFSFPQELGNIENKRTIVKINSPIHYTKFGEVSFIIKDFNKINKLPILSLVYPNWLILFFKETNEYLIFQILKQILLSEKQFNLVFYLFTLKNDINKYLPGFWKNIVLLLMKEDRILQENYYLILNLKYIFYYEVSTINQKQNNQYNNFGYIDGIEVFDFFKNNFNFLSKILFRTFNENRQNILEGEIENTSKYFTNMNNGDKIEDSINIEILNIFYILLSNLKENEIISSDINNFIIKLTNIYLNNDFRLSKHKNYMKNISNIF